MNERQRKRLAEMVTEHLRREWGGEFTDEDAIKIYDFCMDEAETDDVLTTALEYEIKYA